MDTGFLFLPGHFEYTTGKTKLLRMHLAPFLLIPETFSVMALALNSAIFFDFTLGYPATACVIASKHVFDFRLRPMAQYPSVPGSRVNSSEKKINKISVRLRSQLELSTERL